MQATSTSPFLAHLSPEALQANQAMLARQAKQMARQAKARQNLEQTIRDMEFREKKLNVNASLAPKPMMPLAFASDCVRIAPVNAVVNNSRIML